jgi:hypothetical protein
VSSRFRSLLPTINWIRWSLAPALIFIAAGVDRGYQTDFWHHLARGREIVARGQVVNSDLFTFTIHGQAIQDANWLMQVIYFRLFAWGGIAMVQLINAMLLAAAMLVLVRNCKQASESLLASAAAGACAFLSLWQLLLIRPQSVSLLLFVLLYWVLEQIPRRKPLAILVPILMALWANVHGGFAIGLLLIAGFAGAAPLETSIHQGWHGLVLWWGGHSCLPSSLQVVAFLPTERTRIHDRQECLPHPKTDKNVYATNQSAAPYLQALVLGAAATLLNPYGWRIYQYVGVVASRASGRHVEEWLPPSLASWVGLAFAASVVGLVVLYRLARRWPTAREFCLLLCFLPLACRSVRMLAWWWLIAAPILATLLAQTIFSKENRQEHPPSRAAALGIVLLLTICFMSIPQTQSFSPLFGGFRSSHRVEEDLQSLSPQLAGGRTFTRLEWGEYLDWSLGASPQGFIDGRIEAYPDAVWQDYCSVTSVANNWQGVLNRWRVDHLLLDQQYHAQLIAAVMRSKGWRETARRGPAVLFVREPIDAPAVVNSDF